MPIRADCAHAKYGAAKKILSFGIPFLGFVHAASLGTQEGIRVRANQSPNGLIQKIVILNVVRTGGR